MQLQTLHARIHRCAAPNKRRSARCGWLHDNTAVCTRLNPDFAALEQEALGLVAPVVRERYQQRGKQFSFADDRADAASPKEWVQQQHVSFDDAGKRDTQVNAPNCQK